MGSFSASFLNACDKSLPLIICLLFIAPPVITVTVKLAEAKFPDGSENTYSTTVTPRGKESPGCAERLTRKAVPELSVAFGSVYVTGMLVTPAATKRTISPSVTMRGGVRSSVGHLTEWE